MLACKAYRIYYREDVVRVVCVADTRVGAGDGGRMASVKSEQCAIERRYIRLVIKRIDWKTTV